MRVSEEIGELLGNGNVVLCKDICIKPHFLFFASMTVLENLHLILRRNPVPPADMFEIAGLMRLGALLVMETKEAAVFFD